MLPVSADWHLPNHSRVADDFADLFFGHRRRSGDDGDQMGRADRRDDAVLQRSALWTIRSADLGWLGTRPNRNRASMGRSYVQCQYPQRACRRNFPNVGFGVRAGKPHFMDAECPILRCRFLHCSKAGVSIESFNALDWWIWYSTFEDCRVGVTNDPGAGHFHVYESVFRRSTEVDIKMSNCSYFGIRHNFSTGSKAFFIAAPRTCSGSTTLQDNTVLDPTGPIAIQVGNVGPCLLVDNMVRSNKDKTKGEHAVYVNEPGTTLSVGNTFTMADAIDIVPAKARTKLLTIDDKVVNPEKIKVEEPVMSGVLPNHHRPDFEIAVGSDGAAIQRRLMRRHLFTEKVRSFTCKMATLKSTPHSRSLRTAMCS